MMTSIDLLYNSEPEKGNVVYKFLDLHFWIKRIIFLFLLFLPFQNIIVMFFERYNENVKVVAYFDEIFTIIIFFIVLFFRLLKPKYYKLYLNYPFTKYLLIFILIALFSMTINKVKPTQGFFGIYDVIKNIVILYLICSLNWKEKELKSMILMIIFVGLILAIAGIIVEILLICKIIEPEYLFYTEKRMGIYRTVSIVGPGNGNYLGMYCLMSLFFVHSLLKGPKKIFYSAVLIINIFLTFSRQTWLSGILYLILKNERRDLKYFISVFLLIFSLLLIFPITFSETRYDPEVYYRSFTILKSLEILKSNLLVGKSPGTFGGVASVVFKSNLYDDWPDYFKDMVHRIGSIDAFWFSILAETGLLGFISLLLFFISLYKYLHNLDNAKNKFYKIGHDLSIFCLALVIMNFMNGFNRAFLVYTFFTLCGTYISFYRNLTSGLKFNVNESNLP